MIVEMQLMILIILSTITYLKIWIALSNLFILDFNCWDKEIKGRKTSFLLFFISVNGYLKIVILIQS